ncbi:PIG-L family deacetylase [Dokdonella sp.]|uniref:PIG-L deacetylase family protein n=1 Tax=Dokdonella sp. TaxID=2291710 RepID=UPI0025C69FF5|nr:PIG-L family deacetylase [Dokdonella sp.]MBX3688295.1 PIG-L family deacetylase [Dokdonella sp.]
MRPQSPEIRFAPRDRLLVLAPHPDDETLASGELIQLALAAGAHVRVLFVTDGENNPWPQRWMEMRLWINAAARRRWGERRRGEAVAALKVLGDGAITFRFLGFADQSVTAALMDDDALLVALAAEVTGFAPTHLVAPALGDRHPDHSALHILSELALLQTGHSCVRLTYLVHGPGRGYGESSAAQERQQRKLEALACHASQLGLSRGRLQRIARAPERFAIAAWTPTSSSAGEADRLRIAMDVGVGSSLRHHILVVVAGEQGIWRARVRLPLLPRAGMSLEVLGDSPLQLHLDGGMIVIPCPSGAGKISNAWMKLHRREPRLVVFDKQTWQALVRVDC